MLVYLSLFSKFIFPISDDYRNKRPHPSGLGLISGREEGGRRKAEQGENSVAKLRIASPGIYLGFPRFFLKFSSIAGVSGSFPPGFDVSRRQPLFPPRILVLDVPQHISHYLDTSDSRLHGSRGCLGCCTKPTPIIAVDEPTKGLRIQGRTVKKPSLSEDFWSTSTYEMENSGVQSQRSISSISTSYQPHDPHSVGGSTSNAPEFVNHGLLLWTQTRQQWIGNKKMENPTQQVQEPKLNWNSTYDSLLGTNKPFPQSIPLAEMVDFLVDIWEQEGMYD